MIDLFCLPVSVITAAMVALMLSAVMQTLTLIFMNMRYKKDADIFIVLAGIATICFLSAEVWICVVVLNQTLFSGNIVDQYADFMWTAAAASALWTADFLRNKSPKCITLALVMIAVIPPLADVNASYYCIAFVSVNLSMAVLFTVAAVNEIKYYRGNINRLSIKEGIDMMADGLAFDDSNGNRILINNSMNELLRRMKEQEHEKIKTDKGFIVRFPEDTWEFSQEDLNIDGKNYVQYMASEITEEDSLNRDIERYNEYLDEMNGQLQWMVDNVEKIREEEEIIAMKSRVHDVLGQRLSIVHQVIENSDTDFIGAEDLKPMLIGLADDIRENRKIDQDAHLKEIIEAFSFSGMQIIMYGSLLGNGTVDEVIVRMIREAATNALRHAGARKLFVFIDSWGSSATVKVSNDGISPVNDVTEGNGLKGIRRRVKEAGGTFEVISCPVFMLKAEFKF